MIKTPVRYDGSDKYGEYIVDKDGTPILDVDPAGWMGSTQTITIGEYVATAINEHADIKAKLAVAVEALGLACAFIDGVINMDNPDVTAETFKEVVLAEALDKFNDVAKIRSAYDALAKIKEAQ